MFLVRCLHGAADMDCLGAVPVSPLFSTLNNDNTVASVSLSTILNDTFTYTDKVSVSSSAMQLPSALRMDNSTVSGKHNKLRLMVLGIVSSSIKVASNGI
jgi:hypothetical protein